MVAPATEVGTLDFTNHNIQVLRTGISVTDCLSTGISLVVAHRTARSEESDLSFAEGLVLA